MPFSPEESRRYATALEGLTLSPPPATVELGRNTVTYNSAIRSDESHVRPVTDEELVRALGLGLLNSSAYRYPLDRMYIERFYTIGRPSISRAEVDLILYDPDGLPFAMCEFKAPDAYDREMAAAIREQLFRTAPQLGEPSLLVYATIDASAPAGFRCLVIDYTQHKDYDSWVAVGSPAANEVPADYQLPQYPPYTNGGPHDLDETATTADFRAIASSFHSQFFAEHPDTDVFTTLVKCLLAKIYDERQTRRGQAYGFQVLIRNSREEPAQDVFNRVNALYSAAYDHYIERGATDVIDSRFLSPEGVKIVVKAMQSVALTRGAALNGDIIGAFFEEILRSGFKQDKGMYFTHANLVWFMLEAVGIRDLTERTWQAARHPTERMPYVIDPSCGSGTFLLRAMQLMTESVVTERDHLVDDAESQAYFERHFTDAQPNAWAEDFLYGSDPKFVMAITAKVNMVLHGDGSAHVYKWDALTQLGSLGDGRLRSVADARRSVPVSSYAPPISESFDLVVSNPPFGITLAEATRNGISRNFSLPPTVNSEALFLERWFQLLRPGGRLAVVVPESLLNTQDAGDSRLLLYRMFRIKALVSLPRNLFPETPTLTSLLFAQKKSAAEIAVWDAAWAAADAATTQVVSDARATLTTRGGRSASDIERDFILSVASLMQHETQLTCKGRAPITLALPAEMTDAIEAAAFYRRFLGSAGFRLLVQRRIFAQRSLSSLMRRSAFAN